MTYWHTDNFLTESLFNSFNTEMLGTFEHRGEWYTKESSLYEGEVLSEAPVRLVGEPHPGRSNFLNSARQLKSPSLPRIANSIKKYMIEELKFINPTARMVWFQYHSNKKKMGLHLDKELSGKPREQSFTSLLYMHDTWEDEWEGEICFSDGNKLLPKPNRLVVCRRDVEHWVNHVNHNLDDYQRMFLFIAWVTDNDF